MTAETIVLYPCEGENNELVAVLNPIIIISLHTWLAH